MSNPFKKAGAQGEAAVQAINTPTFRQTMLQYKASPLSLVLRILVTAAAILTVAVLLFLVAYIVIMGLPNLKPSCSSWSLPLKTPPCSPPSSTR